MSRRSSRRTTKKSTTLPPNITTGLTSLIIGNETTISTMLSVTLPKHTDTNSTQSLLLTALTDCMSMNNLSAEALLARFFPVEMLRTYCEERLRVSGKGNEATLAARIAKAWGKPDFVPFPIDDDNNNNEKQQSDDDNKKTNEVKGSTKKRNGEPNDNETNKSTAKKRKLYTNNEKRPPFSVTVPPGPLGLTIQQYNEDYIITAISPQCSIQPSHKVRVGDVLRAIDRYELLSLKDLVPTSDQSRELTFSTRVISRKAADHPKGSLLYMKEMKLPMFRIMDYTGVAEKYGGEFLDELDPPNRGRTGTSILVGALNSLGRGGKK